VSTLTTTEHKTVTLKTSTLEPNALVEMINTREVLPNKPELADRITLEPTTTLTPKVIETQAASPSLLLERTNILMRKRADQTAVDREPALRTEAKLTSTLRMPARPSFSSVESLQTPTKTHSEQYSNATALSLNANISHTRVLLSLNTPTIMKQ